MQRPGMMLLVQVPTEHDIIPANPLPKNHIGPPQPMLHVKESPSTLPLQICSFLRENHARPNFPPPSPRIHAVMFRMIRRFPTLALNATTAKAH